MLEAGYLEDWEWNATLSGVPQGGVVSPVLSNIYLDRLDKFAGTVLIPEYTPGNYPGRESRIRQADQSDQRRLAAGRPPSGAAVARTAAPRPARGPA